MRSRLHASRKRTNKTARLRRLANFLKEVINEFLTDNCPHLAASISYYLLFSLFPLTLGIISVLGFFTTSEDTQTSVVEAICDFIPIASEDMDIPGAIADVTDARAATGAIATIGLLWGGSAVFSAVRKALNTAWGIRKPRPFLHERALELGMMLGVGLLLLVSISMTTTKSIFQTYDLSVAGIDLFNGAFLWQTILSLFTILLAFITFLLLYKVIPNTRVRWGDVWGGALLAAVGFEIVKQVFMWYSTDVANYSSVYGPVGAVIAFLLWTYFSAMILLFCAKLTAVYSRHRISLFEDAAWRGRRRIRRSIQSFTPLPRFTPPGSSFESGTGPGHTPPNRSRRQ